MNDDVVPKGYITGLLREPGSHETRVAHLYKGDFADPGFPMCINGWNRYKHTEYSIWRGNVGRKGICKVCLKRANAGLDAVSPKCYEECDATNEACNGCPDYQDTSVPQQDQKD